MAEHLHSTVTAALFPHQNSPAFLLKSEFKNLLEAKKALADKIHREIDSNSTLFGNALLKKPGLRLREFNRISHLPALIFASRHLHQAEQEYAVSARLLNSMHEYSLENWPEKFDYHLNSTEALKIALPVQAHMPLPILISTFKHKCKQFL